MGHPATREGGLSPTPERVGAHTVGRWLGVPPGGSGSSGGSRVTRKQATAGPGWTMAAQTAPTGRHSGSGCTRVAQAVHGRATTAQAALGWLADGSGGAHRQAMAAQAAPRWLRRRSRAAVSRSCTFFLQTAISKRRDHADLPGKPGPGNRMNVQRRPSCTFILSPDAPQGEKTLEPRHQPHQDPRMNVQHGPAPPAGTTTSRRRPPPPPHDLHATSTRKQTPAPRPLQDDTTSRYPDKEADPDGPPPTPPPQTGPLP